MGTTNTGLLKVPLASFTIYAGLFSAHRLHIWCDVYASMAVDSACLPGESWEKHWMRLGKYSSPRSLRVQEDLMAPGPCVSHSCPRLCSCLSVHLVMPMVVPIYSEPSGSEIFSCGGREESCCWF